jgi:hypothetical protein
MHNDYFWHKAYGDYPVVGKNGRKSFCAWRTLNKTVILNQRRGHDLINSFRLPTEAEWVFCKRRIRVNNLGVDHIRK